ncbi:hypothetical protein K435DRAFT_876570 [Dendrothele bispora CBS 962.96]|uniref:Uncharacterized protein n=1 Tax=Dendrothele bispora (strain CBS 962.96) TaxID=1314807 RepID=A0A4V4HB89_DENBC|nr:hypothetical protein K435DRAFT_876570 [Dendrothele bispora CBS 962.96]
MSISVANSKRASPSSEDSTGSSECKELEARNTNFTPETAAQTPRTSSTARTKVVRSTALGSQASSPFAFAVASVKRTQMAQIATATFGSSLAVLRRT